MLKIKHLTFSYQKKILLKELNLSVKRGEVISIIGPSGSGKTTLFKLIAGLNTQESGSISVLDQIHQRNHLISYMMQEDLLLPWKTLFDNLMIVFELENISWKDLIISYSKRKKLFKKRVFKIIEDVGLKGFENYYPSALSGGMRQRASLARSLLFKRPLLLLDEPFGSIDAVKRKILYGLLNEIKGKYDLTILFVTHDINDAIHLSNKIYFLDQGSLKEYEGAS